MAAESINGRVYPELWNVKKINIDNIGYSALHNDELSIIFHQSFFLKKRMDGHM
jgi:hypothetical protein